MLKALALGLQFAAALATLAFSIGIVITGMLNRRLVQKRQPRPEFQEPPPPLKTPSTETIDSPKSGILRSSQQMPVPATPLSIPTITLNTRDHGIYMTTDSQLMIRHPKEDALLRELDKILYVAMHRNGTPFTMPPELDTSASSGQPIFKIAQTFGDDEFLAIAPISLPSPDGHLWYIAGDKHPQRVGPTR